MKVSVRRYDDSRFDATVNAMPAAPVPADPRGDARRRMIERNRRLSEPERSDAPATDRHTARQRMIERNRNLSRPVSP